MSYRLLIPVISLFIVVVTGCKKESSPPACEMLKHAMTVDDVNEAKLAITSLIDQLPSKNYTAENLARLVALISGDCNINALTGCFDCIETLPSQSEISLSLISQGSTITKTIDISYTPDNKMTVRNMH